MSATPLRTGEVRSSGKRHLAVADGETLCGLYIRTRPIETGATAVRTADNLCRTCQRIARDEHGRALMSVYEMADQHEHTEG